MRSIGVQSRTHCRCRELERRPLLVVLALGGHAQLHVPRARRQLRAWAMASPGVLQQVHQHLLDQDRVDLQHWAAAARRSWGQAHVVAGAARCRPAPWRCSTICATPESRLALRFAALHEGADAVDDLAGALGLARGLVRARPAVRLRVMRAGAHARHHAVAVVVDRRQRLVQLVCHAGRHLAHGHQAARHLRALGLVRGLLLGMQPRRDVAGNQHLRQPPVGPL
jgi:hypothetical protein